MKHTMLASKLHNALMYYLKSREITDDFDALVSLICADQLKELIPKSCLDYVLAQEKDSWLKHDDLASVVDTYMAAHDASGALVKTHTATDCVLPSPEPARSPLNYPVPKPEGNTEPKPETRPSKEEIMRKGLCFNCLEHGHTSKMCTKPKVARPDKRPTRVRACAVDTVGSVDTTLDAVKSLLEPSTLKDAF